MLGPLLVSIQFDPEKWRNVPTPSPFLFPPFASPFLFSSATRPRPAENQLGGLGSAVSPSGPSEAPAANAFRCILSVKIAHGDNISGYLSKFERCVMRKEQLYRQ